jgi:purine operon repressor
MQKIKRSERIGAMIKILSDTPNRIFTLNSFSDRFAAAKSTISEDIDIAGKILEQFGLGRLETVTGAAGGVRYVASPGREEIRRFVDEMCRRLSEPDRILPGGYLYMLDELSHPAKVSRMGEILAGWFRETRPDFVVTVETKGIPVALMVARCLNVPMITARRDVRISEGSVVSINYVTGSTHKIQSMSLPKRAVGEGQRALIIDDFMKRGGTLRGVVDLMREFSVTVAGMAVVMSTAEPERKLVENCQSLVVLHGVDETARKVDVRPSGWVRGTEG